LPREYEYMHGACICEHVLILGHTHIELYIYHNNMSRYLLSAYILLIKFVGEYA
jgi:hypothetical protein